MHEGKSLIKNTFIYTIGNLGSKILTFLLLPLYSFYLTKSELGVFDIILTSVSLFVPIITLQISEAVYRWLLTAKSMEEKIAIVSNSFFIVVSGILIFYFIYLIIFSFFNFEYSGYFAIILFSSCLLPFFQQVTRGLLLNKLYASSGLLNAFLVVLFNILVLIVFNYSIKGLFVALFLSNFIAIFFIIFKINFIRYLRIKQIKSSTYKELLVYSWPLIPNAISWWLINASDRYIILYLLGTDANGIFAVSSRFPSIITVLNSIFMLAWQDHAIGETIGKIKKEKFASKVFNAYVSFELSAVLILIASSQYIVSYLLDSKFYDAWRYMPLLYIGVAYSAFSAYFGASYLKEKKTKGIFVTSVIGGIVNVIISFSLMPHIGLYAPALGTFLSFIIVFILRKIETNSFFRIEINYIRLLGLSLLCVLFFIITLKNSAVLNLILFISSIIIAFIINKKLLFRILNLVKSRFITKNI